MGMCANESNLSGCHSLLNSTGKFVLRVYCVDIPNTRVSLYIVIQAFKILLVANLFEEQSSILCRTVITTTVF